MKGRTWVGVAVAGALALGALAYVAVAQGRGRSEPVGAGDELASILGPDVWLGMSSAVDQSDLGGDPGAAPGPERPAWRRGGFGMRGMGMRGALRQGMQHRAEMLRRLDLNADQRRRIAGIRDRQMRHGIQARADIRIAMLDLGRMLRAERPDKAQIDAQIDKVARLRAELQKSRVASLLEVRTVLTPDQLQKLRQGRSG